MGCSYFDSALWLRSIFSAVVMAVLMHQEQSDLPLGQAVSYYSTWLLWLVRAVEF